MNVFKVPAGRGTQEWKTGRSVAVPESKPHGIRRTTPEEALASPVGCELPESFEQFGSVAVIVPDATRLWQNVPLMARALRSRLGRKAVTWVFAAGMHRAVTESEMELLVGDARLPEDTTVSHDCDRVVSLGCATSRGTPAELCPEVARADCIWMIGGVVYHDLAGFSGGRKGIIPGVSGRRSVQKNHASALAGETVASSVGCGLLEGNPVAEDMEEYTRLALRGKSVFLLNAVPDGKGAPYCYAGGDPLLAWRHAVEAAKSLQTLWVPERFGGVVVSCGGFPADIDLYQSTKSLPAVTGALRPGGGIVLCADLEDGPGPADFGESMHLAISDRQKLLNRLRESFSIPAFIALKSMRDLAGRPVALVSSRTDIPFPGPIFPTVQEAWDWIEEKLSPGPVLYVEAGNGIVVRVSSEDPLCS